MASPSPGGLTFCDVPQVIVGHAPGNLTFLSRPRGRAQLARGRRRCARRENSVTSVRVAIVGIVIVAPLASPASRLLSTRAAILHIAIYIAIAVFAKPQELGVCLGSRGARRRLPLVCGSSGRFLLDPFESFARWRLGALSERPPLLGAEGPPGLGSVSFASGAKQRPPTFRGRGAAAFRWGRRES
eukprot:6162919-Pyramimonas_sp.AAC.1